MRICYWDVESSGLDGDVGRLLCSSILTADDKMVTFRNDRIKAKRNMADDAALAVKIRDLLEDHHIVVTWFGKGFDQPFLNTRLIAGGHRVIRPMLHLDPCWQLKGWRGIKTRNAKLATAAEFFEITDRKMPVDVKVWIEAAQGGDRKAMDILCERCESDVKILQAVTTKILDTGLVKNISIYP